MSSRKEQKEQARQAREAVEQQMAADAAKKRRLSIIGGVVGLALIAAIAAAAVSYSGSTKTDSSDAKAVNSRYAGIPQKGIVLGEPAAKATIIEYADLRCPYCRDFDEGIMPTIVGDLIRTGKAKMIFRNLTLLDSASPSGKDSSNAAKFAGAAGLQNKLFPFVDLFYRNQGQENTDYVTEDFLINIAKQVDGLNPQEAWDNRENPKVTGVLDDDTARAQEAGVTGTPTIFVGANEKTARKITLNDLTDPQPIVDAVEALQ